MIAAERRRRMVDYLNQRGRAKVAELAALLDVSDMTVHRDLQRLADRDLVIKVHGGAVSPHVVEIPFHSRGVHNQVAKQALAREAVKLVAPGMTVFLSPGTTVAELARVMPKDGLRVITSSLPIAQQLIEAGELDIVLTGGDVRRFAEALVGPVAQTMLDNEFIHLTFMAVTGIDVEHGLSVYSESEALVLQSVYRASRKTILLTDSSKYDRVMGPTALSLDAPHMVLSAPTTPEAYRTYFSENDVELREVSVQDMSSGG